MDRISRDRLEPFEDRRSIGWHGLACVAMLRDTKTCSRKREHATLRLKLRENRIRSFQRNLNRLLRPWRALAVLALACAGVATVSGSQMATGRPGEEVRGILVEGKRLLEAGRYEEAIAKLDRAIAMGQPRAELLYLRGECYRKTWWLDKALVDYDRAVQSDPRYANALLARGLVLEYKGYWDKAIADYDAATEHAPRMSLPYIRRGGILWQRGQHEKAKRDLNTGIQWCNERLQANASDVQTYRARALAYRTLEQYDRAIEDYGRMIRIDPHSIEAYVERGRTHAKKKDKAASVADFDQAIALATQAIARQPGDTQAYRLRTEAYDARAFAWKHPEDFRRAAADCNTLLELAPHCPTVYFRRGHVRAGASHFAGDEQASAEHFKQAEADLGEVIRLDRTYAVAWQERGLLYTRAALRHRRPELAQRGAADLTEMIRLVPGAARAYCARGSAYGLAGDYGRAMADFTEAIRLCPEMADAYSLRGGANLALGNQEAAQADLARAQELNNRMR